MPRFFIGPMSFNIVDAIIDFCEKEDFSIGLIPSRRQIEDTGGYVNKWTTKEFASHVRKRSKKVLLQRDHGGPGQGNKKDNGISSFLCDARSGFDLIHIDPWKQYQDLEEGISATADYIKLLCAVNDTCKFEVGTEEAIRPYEASDLDHILTSLKENLGPLFERIDYAVIQFGTRIEGIKNIGLFDEQRCLDMVAICKKHELLSKEHNGDYLTSDEIKRRFELGLDSINIAPEFGQMETMCYLSNMNGNIDEYYNICLESRRWVKWVDKDFIPADNKEELIKICGHYVLSDDRFKSIKPDIDLKIKQTIKEKLKDLYNAIG